LVNGAVAADGDIEHEVAVLAHYIRQHSDDLLDCLVSVLLRYGAAVMPVTDAGVGLPRLGADAVGDAALDILDKRTDVRRLDVLPIDHGIHDAAISRRA